MKFTKLRKYGFLLPLSLLAIITPSCDAVTEMVEKGTGTEASLPTPAGTVYTIKKGSQHAVLSYKAMKTANLRFETTFDNSAIYQTTDPVNQADINKLYGVSDCGSEHHTNSARFGWRWYNNQLEIHAYTYVNKVRQSKYIGSVALGKASMYELRLEDNQYVFILDGKQVTMPRYCSGLTQGYKLFPYFGGDEKAPHDIKITIRDLN